MKENARQFYLKKAVDCDTEAVQLQQKYTRVAFLRLAYFLVWLALFILGFQWHPVLSLGLIYIGIIGFSRLMKYHDNIEKELNIRKRSSKICKEEIEILKHNFLDRNGGDEFESNLHPYAHDMDIFGTAGLFAFYNRCKTTLGRERLADYFLNQVSKGKIIDRQLASQELESKSEWCIRFQAEGFDIKDSAQHIATIRHWLEDENHITDRSNLYWISIVLPLLTIIGFAGLWYYYSFIISLIALVPAIYILNREKKNVYGIQNHVNKSSEILLAYSDMISHIESSDFNSPLLKKSTAAFIHEPKASLSIKKLSKQIDNLNVRYNIFGIVLNIFTMWELHWARKLENWRNIHKELLPAWFEALAEIEALQSIATVGFHHPEWAIPKIQGEKLQGQSIGHPLINPTNRISNDFDSFLQNHIYLVTGSNMGGKSTFLRTVGVQIVLTYMGSRVCADTWAMPEDVLLYSSMRTQDALQESTSGFYAELKRLEVLIQRVSTNEPIFFLLDEILKGTNSVDRNKGAAALMKQLLKFPAAGMISTHDLTLGDMEKELPGKLENICFEVDVNGEELTFDYKLRKGISKSFNATQLMRRIGIEV